MLGMQCNPRLPRTKSIGRPIHLRSHAGDPWVSLGDFRWLQQRFRGLFFALRLWEDLRLWEEMWVEIEMSLIPQ
jgi:hypothetical protein